MSYPVFHPPASSTLYIHFTSYGKTNGESITLTGLAVTDIEIYKNGSTTQRSSDAGYTLLDTDGIDFDSITGLHGISIDLSDNTDSGFYAVGSQYTVVISTVTIDSQTVTFIAAYFRIMPAESSAAVQKVDVSHWLGTAAATPTVGGVPEVDVTHWIGTAAATPTVAGVPEVDVTHLLGSAAWPEWINAQAWNGTAVTGTLSATQATTDITGYGDDTFNYRWAIYFTSGARMVQKAIITDYVSASGLFTFAPALTGAPANTDAFVLLPIVGGMAVGDITGSLSGSAGSIGAGGIAAAAFAAGAIDNAAIAADAIGSSELAATAANEIRDAIFARAFAAKYGSFTFEQLVGLTASVLAGILSGAATTNVLIKGLDGTTTVVDATVDADGNRSALTVTP